MSQLLSCFWENEDGAVTVDWVVLTGAIVGLGMLVLQPIAYTTDNSAQKIATAISNVKVGYGE